MDAELRQRSQAEIPQIRDWLDEFTGDERQVTPEFECLIRPAKRDPVVGLDGRVHIWKPVSLWANVDGGSFDANSESASEVQRQGRPIVSAGFTNKTALDGAFIQGGIKL